MEGHALELSESQIVTGNTAHTQPENRAYYPALDGLRATAFIMVFLQHYLGFPWGWTGVNVFFVLSGFLITGILFDTRSDPHRARNFYLRRTLRIFPLYYGIFLLILLTQPLMHWKPWSLWWLAWPLYLGNFLRFVRPALPGSRLETAADGQLFSTHGIFLGHFWSLCVEEQFYLLWPWIVFKASGRRMLLWVCAVVVIVAPFLRILAQHTAPQWMLGEELLYRMIPFQLDSLLLGGLVGLLWRGAHREHMALIARIVAPVAGVIAIVYLCYTMSVTGPDWAKNYIYPHWRLTWGLTFINVLSAAIIVCILRPGGWLFKFCCLPPLRWIGRISYGAYVLHDILHAWYGHTLYRVMNILVRHVSPHFKLLWAYPTLSINLFSFSATLALAWLSYRFYESPFLNLKERWTIR